MKDPAFLYYDGDAARDVSHMNRLERGCYFDLIQAQRKFGRLSVDIIKKILGKDFETCWESVKICLSYDNDMYFIEWLELSTIKRKEYSESRRKNRMAEKQEDINNISESYVNHMENENEIVIEDKEVTKNKTKYTADFEKFWQAYPKKEGKIAAFKKWKIAPDRPEINQILVKLELQKKSDQWRDGYIPMPETYISKGRWNDEIKEKRLILVK
jgi:hypothetical protein